MNTKSIIPIGVILLLFAVSLTAVSAADVQSGERISDIGLNEIVSTIGTFNVGDLHEASSVIVVNPNHGSIPFDLITPWDPSNRQQQL